MILAIPRSALLRGLTLAARVAPRKPTLPILSHVLLRASANRLTLSATDLNVSLTAEIAGVCHVERPGAVAVSAADLQRFVASAAGDEISIKVDGSLWADVRCGKAKYRMPALSDRDFPKVPEAAADAVEVNAQVLLEMLNAASYAVSPDDSRESLCGVWLESVEGKCTVASADGHRVVLVKRALGIPAGSRTVCARGAAEFATLLRDHETCRVGFDPKRMSVSAGGVTIAAGLLDFKSAQSVLRDKVAALAHRTAALVDRDQLLAAIKRVAPLAGETRGLVVRSTQTGLALASYHDGSELHDEVACEVTGEIKFMVHPKYLIEAVGRMAGETVTLRCGGELDPVVIQDNDDLAVVMPMRI